MTGRRGATRGEPAKGYDVKAAEWQARLPESRKKSLIGWLRTGEPSCDGCVRTSERNAKLSLCFCARRLFENGLVPSIRTWR